jgi:hypothetical protein
MHYKQPIVCKRLRFDFGVWIDMGFFLYFRESGKNLAVRNVAEGATARTE